MIRERLKRWSANFATPGLLIGLALVMGALYGADQFLARLEDREIGAEARRHYREGEALLKEGRAREAAESFRTAHVLNRDNRAYVLGLASAFIADHRPGRAEETLQEVLAADSNDGAVNLTIARAMAAENRPKDAASYYHRAIYGKWPEAEKSKNIEARLELVKWLSKRGDGEALLAELLPLEEEAKSNDAIERELPALYLQAGALQRAADAYRKWMREEPENADPYAGLARVELEKGNYHLATQYFGSAVRRKPDDGTLKQEEELASAAREMDPTPRRLPSGEKLARSNQILQLAVSAAEACAAHSGDSELLQNAGNLLSGKQAGAASNEMAETRLDLAEQIWKTRPANCDGAVKSELLAVLMRKISQQ